MKQRIITALLMVIIILPAFLMGGVALQLLIGAFGLLVSYEILAVFKDQKALRFVIPIFLIIMLLATSDNTLFISSISLLVIALFFIEILTKEMDITKLSYLFLMICLSALGIRAFLNIYTYDFNAILFVAVVTFSCDSFAYFGGSFFGKHKLIERVSPKKTIEGSLIGWTFAAVLGVLFGMHFLNLEFWIILVSSILLGVIGQIGDLAFSSIKRSFNIKDFGNVFPGHGGALDRIDSLLFNLLMFSFILEMIV